MPKAALRIGIGSVDETNGIVSGCRLAELNHVAQFSGKDGNLVELSITPQLVDDLLNLATQAGRLDAFWTHDRLSDGNKRDELHDSIGAWRNFRKNEKGDPIADLHLAPTQYKERVLWMAKNDPLGVMTSLVFRYNGGRDNARATAIFSADLVKRGAATTALLSAYDNSETNEPKNMTKEELIEFFKTDEGKAILSAHKEESKEPEADNAEMEAQLGVTAADRKDGDDKVSATERAILRGQRAFQREKAGIIEQAKVEAEASFVAKLGKGTITIPAQDGGTKTATLKYNSAVNAKLTAKLARHTGEAKFQVNKEDPDLYAAMLAEQNK